jgi:hypothetical protein
MISYHAVADAFYVFLRKEWAVGSSVSGIFVLSSDPLSPGRFCY